MEIVFQVTERTIDKRGNLLYILEVEVETYWTNLYEEPQTVIGLYHGHETSEQCHSGLKTEMNIELLPSGKMAVNEIVLSVAMVDFKITLFWGSSYFLYKIRHWSNSLRHWEVFFFN